MDKSNPINNKNERDKTTPGTIVASIIIMLAIIVGLIIWYNKTHYNPTFQNNFMTNCENNGESSSGCSCAYNVLENNYTYQEAKDMNANLNSSLVQQWLGLVKSQCGGTNSSSSNTSQNTINGCLEQSPLYWKATIDPFQFESSLQSVIKACENEYPNNNSSTNSGTSSLSSTNSTTNSYSNNN